MVNYSCCFSCGSFRYRAFYLSFGILARSISNGSILPLGALPLRRIMFISSGISIERDLLSTELTHKFDIF